MEKWTNFVLGNLSDVQEKQTVKMLLAIIKTLELAGPYTRITVIHPSSDLLKGEDRVCIMGAGIDYLEFEDVLHSNAHSNISLVDSASSVISENGIAEVGSLYLAVYAKSKNSIIDTCEKLGTKYCVEMHFSDFERENENEPYIHVVGNCVARLSSIADLLLVVEEDILICTECIRFLPAKK